MKEVYCLGSEFNVEIPMQEIGTVEQTAIYIGKHQKKSQSR